MELRVVLESERERELKRERKRNVSTGAKVIWE